MKITFPEEYEEIKMNFRLYRPKLRNLLVRS